MGNFENQMLNAIDILIQQRTSNLQFDKTVRARISQISSLAIGQYKVHYQNSLFYAYSLDLQQTYSVDDEVYVQIHSGDFRKNPTILGRVSRLGERYANTLQIEDRFIDIGTNILTSQKDYGFVSYYPGVQSIQLLSDGGVTLDDLGLSLYKDEAVYLKIGANFRTNLSLDQQSGGGNYGMIVECQYYNPGLFKSHSEQDNDFTSGSREDKYIYIPYVLDVNNMTGQPYRYYAGSDQFAIFPIAGKDLKAIKSITIFCKDFPVSKPIQQVYYNAGVLYTDAAFTTEITKNPAVLYLDQNGAYWLYNAGADMISKATDIWIKDFRFTFIDELTEEDLQGTTLKVITPYGAYFKEPGDQKLLQAQITFGGKRIDPVKTKINFYWFIKDNSVANGSQYYSQYGGTGWRCLNQKTAVDEQETFAADQYKKVIKEHECPSKVSWFKCVAIFDENIIYTTAKLYNLNNDRLITITSTAGTQFDFGIGATTLTCTGTGDTYYWMYSYDGGGLMVDSRRTKSLQGVTIAEAQDFIYYEVTVYNGDTYIGSANITLFNKTDNINPFNVHINNRSQIFKYDNYGVSPASRTKEEWDRMIIPDLSFDIYTSTGQIVELTDNEKQRMLQIRWVIPKDNTMLVVENTQYQTVYAQKGGAYQRRVIKNKANLPFGIANNYDTSKVHNDIILQVVYQGYKIMDNTNFTFTKEGEMGSNGTKYIARLVPNDNYVEEIYFVNGQIRSWSYDEDGKYYVNQTYNRVPSLKMQIWDGSDSPVFDGNPYDANSNKDAWTMVSKGRTDRPAYQVSANGVLSQYLAINAADHKSDAVQGQYTSKQLSDLARNYYATYPLMQVYGGSYTNAIVTGGYKFCMYENDGSRSSFQQTAPFVFKLIKADGTIDDTVDENEIIWTSSWGGAIWDGDIILTTLTNKTARGNRLKITPPNHYPLDGEVNNYITCTYKGTAIYISVHFYLNRYGLDAINGWDGNSIKINTEGDQYIIAPQIGAGDKDDQNRFTGITIGKSFNVDKNASIQIGMMGFHQGERTLFLDAQTGNSIFGKAGNAQIVIGPSDWGAAPAGSIFSSTYYKYSNGKPTQKNDDPNTKQGMLINLVQPSIRWGNGNFIINDQGHLTAKGGGNIAGWKITDTQLVSPANDLFLNSGGNIYGYGKNANGYLMSHNSLNSTVEGFYLGPDGMSIGGKFYVDNTGVMRIGANAVSGNYGKFWTIDGSGTNDGVSFIKSGTQGYQNSVYLGTDKITLGNQFFVDNNGIMKVGYGAVSNSGTHWTINGDWQKSYISYGTQGNFNSVYLGTDKITLGNQFAVDNNGVMKVGYGAVNNTSKHWTINGTSANSYISYGTSAFNASYSSNKLTINSSAGFNEVYLGTDGIRLGKYAAINSSGYATFYNANIEGSVTATSGKIGGWNIDSWSISSNGVTLNANNGYISGGNNWWIYPDGTAYFKNLVLDGQSILSVIQNNSSTVYQTIIQNNGGRGNASWAAWAVHAVGRALTGAYIGTNSQIQNFAYYLVSSMDAAAGQVPNADSNYWTTIRNYINRSVASPGVWYP